MSKSSDSDYNPNTDTEISSENSTMSSDSDEIEELLLENSQRISQDPDVLNPPLPEISTTPKELADAKILVNLYEKSLAGKAPQTTQVKMQQILALTQKMLLKPEKIPTSEYLHKEAVQLVRKKRRGAAKKRNSNDLQSSPSASGSVSIDSSMQPTITPAVPKKAPETTVEITGGEPSKKRKFLIDNPSQDFLDGKCSSNGFEIVGGEEDTKWKTPPTEDQLTKGYSIKGNTHICVIMKNFGGGDSVTTKPYLKIERTYIAQSGYHAQYSFSMPWEHVPALQSQLKNLKKEYDTIVSA